MSTPAEGASSGADAIVLSRWLCEACGLIYDELKGDPDSGIAPGTRFEDIPDDWRCPVCGVGKADFRLLGPSIARAPRPVPARERLYASMPGRAAQRDGVIIVGAGEAGWACASAVREAGYDGPVTLVTACDGTVYSKPALSVAFARGQTADSLARQQGAVMAETLNLRLLSRTWAIDLDPIRKRLITTRGSLGYRYLVIASGSRARKLDWAGDGGSRLFSVNDLQGYASLRASYGDALERARLRGRAPRLLIIGAGLVGCELADDFATGGARVTLLDTAPLPLHARLAADQARALRDALMSRGISFDGGVRPVALQPGPLAAEGFAAQSAVERAQALTVSCQWRSDSAQNQTRVFDLAISAVGVEPQTRLARQAGLRVDRAIVVDPRTLSTDAQGVFALGDCAQVGQHLGTTIEPIGRQAATIAGAITGHPVPFETRDPVWVVKTTCLPLTIRPTRSRADQSLASV
jgi:rubredoxin-NAD+ reductase